MNYQRAIGFGILLWVFIFVILSVLMFIPALRGKTLTQDIIFWIIMIPLVFFLAKWYFKADPPTWKKGFWLGIIALAVSVVLDVAITIPLFVKSYSIFYSDWKLYVGFAEVLVLCMLAGGEFDATFTRRNT